MGLVSLKSGFRPVSYPVSINFRRRKRLVVSRCEEYVVPPPPLPPSPSALPTTPSLSPLQEPMEAEQDLVHRIFDWQAPLALWEWKAWGYYARPRINNVWVNNYPPCTNIPEDINVREIAASLSEDGLSYPERWITGLEHASLPPRPRRWLDEPKPYRPRQCQLNPYLRRKVVGVPPLFWDLGKEPATATHGHSLIAMPLFPPDRAQPATWPMTTEFRISAIADDVELAWPILIRKKHGVTVEDVLEWIYRNFQQHVDTAEWEKCPMSLRENVIMSYDKRGGGSDGLKRIDYLGFHSMFRGVEQSSDGNSWYLFIGRPW
ncbi:hypothetical protein AX14_001368 [Amanita brunnescens Koide BX004]|nr:hypothetical protein AX14_001368 [Amanita brunnescens Koide BX004]